MIQKQIDNLKDRTRPDKVGSFLVLRRDVMFLEFDAAVRHCMRETFLATSNVPAYKVGDRVTLVTDSSSFSWVCLRCSIRHTAGHCSVQHHQVSVTTVQRTFAGDVVCSLVCNPTPTRC